MKFKELVMHKWIGTNSFVPTSDPVTPFTFFGHTFGYGFQQGDTNVSGRLFRYAIVQRAVNENEMDILLQDFTTAIAVNRESLEKRIWATVVSKMNLTDLDRINVVITTPQYETD